MYLYIYISVYLYIYVSIYISSQLLSLWSVVLLLPTSTVAEMIKFDKKMLGWSKAPGLTRSIRGHVLWMMQRSLLYSKGSIQLSEDFFLLKCRCWKKWHEQRGGLCGGDSTACTGTLCVGKKWQGFGSRGLTGVGGGHEESSAKHSHPCSARKQPITCQNFCPCEEHVVLWLRRI